MHKFIRIFVIAIGVVHSRPAWAACEAEEAAVTSAKTRLSTVLSRVGGTDSTLRPGGFYENTTVRQGDEIEEHHSAMSDDLNYMAARKHYRDVWLTWRKAQASYDQCSQTAKNDTKGT